MTTRSAPKKKVLLWMEIATKRLRPICNVNGLHCAHYILPTSKLFILFLITFPSNSRWWIIVPDSHETAHIDHMQKNVCLSKAALQNQCKASQKNQTFCARGLAWCSFAAGLWDSFSLKSFQSPNFCSLLIVFWVITYQEPSEKEQV